MGTHKCIFCLSEGNIFHTIEHIVPESLGNTDDILEDCICDKCQNYLGKEIENYILAKTPFGFWRTIAGTVNKKGKKPFFDPSQNPKQKGPIADFHPCTDNGFIVHPADGESIIETEISNESLLDSISNGEKNSFKIVMTPKMLIYMGRFLGKIALEYWCKAYGDDVFREDFDTLRQYVRNGTTKYPSIYVFRCTETQAEFYFFKFGADAEILEPAGLAEKFREMYQKAYQLYA